VPNSRIRSFGAAQPANFRLGVNRASSMLSAALQLFHRLGFSGMCQDRKWPVSLDHVVSALLEMQRHVEAERFGGLEN